MSTTGEFPEIRQVVLDCTDARALAEFYRQLLGWRYRDGDEPGAQGEAGRTRVRTRTGSCCRSSTGTAGVAFQQVDQLRESTWPEPEVPQQLHLDMTVPTAEDLDAQHERVLSLGGQLRYDRSNDPQEPLRVYADPAGHPFCIFVAP